MSYADEPIPLAAHVEAVCDELVNRLMTKIDVEVGEQLRRQLRKKVKGARS